MVKALPFIHQPEGVARKVSNVKAAVCRFETHVRNYPIFLLMLLPLLSGLEIAYHSQINFIACKKFKQ